MDLRRTFAPGMGYVALSRVEGLQGLYLNGVNERMFLVSPDAVRLDGELRLASAQASDMLAHDGIAAFRQNIAVPTMTSSRRTRCSSMAIALFDMYDDFWDSTDMTVVFRPCVAIRR